MRSKKDLIITIVLLAVMAAIIVFLCIDLAPLIREVALNTEDESVVSGYVTAYGVRGAFMLVALQTLQVITAFFPAQPIQVLSGLCYGTWYGLAISIAGYVIGNLVVFAAIRQVRNTFDPYFSGKRRKEKKVRSIFSVAFLNRLKHPEIVAAVLYFIPGLPNGFLPYIFARTKLSMTRYLLTIAVASVPAVLLCTTTGARFARGDNLTAFIFIGVLLVLVAVVLIYRKRLLDWIERTTRRREGLTEGDTAPVRTETEAVPQKDASTPEMETEQTRQRPDTPQE